MRYLIDGYNVCHAWGLLRPRAPGAHHPGQHELERARMQFIGRLAGLASARTAITVVFDAANAPVGVPDMEECVGIQLRFTLKGTADDLIEELISHDSDPRRLAVVSDDHRIQRAARQRHCRAMTSIELEQEIVRQRRMSAEAARAGGDKPEGVSEKEAQEWLKRFGIDEAEMEL